MNKGIMIFIVLFFAYGLYDCSNRAKEKEAQRVRSELWKKSSAGMDTQAEWRSVLKDYPVKSQTGALFYKGMRCRSDCSGHIAGYEYAVDNNIEDKYKCDESDSLSFTEGCSKAVDDIITERQPLEDAPRDYDYDTPRGRY
ncbi:hypothetical protein ACAX46_004600 [Providencia rettgeri]